jgi:hypothetical protein
VSPRPPGPALPERWRPRQDRPVLQEAAQVVRQFLRRRVPVGGPLGAGLEYDRLQVRGDGLVQAPRPARLVLGDLPEQFLAVAAVEGGSQGQQLVQRHAERVDVGAVVHRLAPAHGLLRAHVAQRSHQVAREREPGVGAEAGQAEVRDPELALPVHQQVGRLHVPVEHAQLVGVLQRLGRLGPETGHRAEEGRMSNAQ